MESMTKDEIKEFLLGSARTAKLATVREDGRPHVAPIWFDMDGEDLIFTTWHTSVKGLNLTRDPRAAICIDDERPPFSFVIIEGEAHIDTEPQHLATWAARIAGRYKGADLAEAYGKRNAVEGVLLVRMTPTHVIARKGISD